MKVDVLAYDGTFASGLTALLDVLETANALRCEVGGNVAPWQVTTVGFRRRVSTAAGHVVTTEPASLSRGADLLVVPAIAGKAPGPLISQVSGDGMRAARRLISETRSAGTHVASACTGTFLLAESGILDGRSATTTWWLAPAFRKRYPAVLLDEKKMVTTSDGVTTAGAAFGHVDLALAIVRMTSPALAEVVARYMVIDERPAQSAYAIASALARDDSLVSSFERWIRQHMEEPLSVAHGACSLGVSERTLQRAVRKSLGVSPVRFMQDLRAERAVHLLRTTDLSVGAIARAVGYEHPATLRALLRTQTGSTASALRGRRAE